MVTLKEMPLMASSVLPPIGGAASPWAIKPIDEDVDILDNSSEMELKPADGKLSEVDPDKGGADDTDNLVLDEVEPVKLLWPATFGRSRLP